MLVAVRSGQFKRDIKRLAKQGKDLAKLRNLVLLLLDGGAPPSISRITRCAVHSGATGTFMSSLIGS